MAQRRKARGQVNLPTFSELEARKAAAAQARAKPPLEPSGKAAPALAPPSMNAGSRHSDQPAKATPTAAPAAALPAAAAAPDRTYEDAEKWLQSNHNAGLTSIPPIWVSVTDLFVLPLRSEILNAHYKTKTNFLLDCRYFPQFKVCHLRGTSTPRCMVLVGGGYWLAQKWATRSVDSRVCIELEDTSMLPCVVRLGCSVTVTLDQAGPVRFAHMHCHHLVSSAVRQGCWNCT